MDEFDSELIPLRLTVEGYRDALVIDLSAVYIKGLISSFQLEEMGSKAEFSGNYSLQIGNNYYEMEDESATEALIAVLQKEQCRRGDASRKLNEEFEGFSSHGYSGDDVIPLGRKLGGGDKFLNSEAVRRRRDLQEGVTSNYTDIGYTNARLARTGGMATYNHEQIELHQYAIDMEDERINYKLTKGQRAFKWIGAGVCLLVGAAMGVMIGPFAIPLALGMAGLWLLGSHQGFKQTYLAKREREALAQKQAARSRSEGRFQSYQNSKSAHNRAIATEQYLMRNEGGLSLALSLGNSSSDRLQEKVRQWLDLKQHEASVPYHDHNLKQKFLLVWDYDKEQWYFCGRKPGEDGRLKVVKGYVTADEKGKDKIKWPELHDYLSKLTADQKRVRTSLKGTSKGKKVVAHLRSDVKQHLYVMFNDGLSLGLPLDPAMARDMEHTLYDDTLHAESGENVPGDDGIISRGEGDGEKPVRRFKDRGPEFWSGGEEVEVEVEGELVEFGSDDDETVALLDPSKWK